MLIDEILASRRQRAKRFESVNGYPQTNSYNLGSMVNTSSFFNYMGKEPLMFDEILNRVGLESKRVTPTSGKHLNQA